MENQCLFSSIKVFLLALKEIWSCILVIYDYATAINIQE